MDYTAAGLCPQGFWGLTFRLYDLHMQGAAKRISREIEVSNRLAWNTAALSGAAFSGQLPKFEKVFSSGSKVRAAAQQSAEVLEAHLKMLAIAFGAKLEEMPGPSPVTRRKARKA